MKLLAVLLVFSCHLSFTQVPPVRKWEWFNRLRNSNSDTTYVLNFWATWCKPCVEELPFFDSIGKVFAKKKVKVILISLDYYKDIEKKMPPFFLKHPVTSDVVVLHEPDYNSWIDKVSNSWSGAIPATLIFNNPGKFTFFHEGEWNFTGVYNVVEPLLLIE